MSADKLQQLYHYAWDTFYQDEPQNMKMFKLLKKVVKREKEADTFRPRERALAGRAFGRHARSSDVSWK
jgi:hypothetical protein